MTHVCAHATKSLSENYRSGPMRREDFRAADDSGTGSTRLLSVTIVMLCFLGFVVPETAAAIIEFMPGDAFFHAKLTELVLQQLPAKGGTAKLNYSTVPLSGDFGGYAGFECLEIKNVPPRMIAALRRVYAELRRYDPKVVRFDVDDQGKEIATEINGFHLFVYNRDVQWKIQHIGLKYNEHWVEPPAAAKVPSNDRPPSFLGEPVVPPPVIMYESFLANYAAVVEDWKNAGRFPELKVEVPKGIGWALGGPEIIDPVSVDAKDIQLVVCSDDDLKLCFRRAKDTEFFVVTIEGAKRFTWTKKGLVNEDFPLADQPSEKLGVPQGSEAEKRPRAQRKDERN